MAKPKKTLAGKLGKRTKTQTPPPHIMVYAGAGTGKTTTLIEGVKALKGVKTSITPSPQQQAIWDQLALSKDAATICMTAFNKDIADVLKTRIPNGCEAKTNHSMGFAAVRRAFGSLTVNGYRTGDLLADKVLKKDKRELMRQNGGILINAVEKLVAMCKVNLIETPTPEVLAELASYYDIDTEGCQEQVHEFVPQVLDLSLTPDVDGAINYDDMVWLPVALDLPIFRFDLLMVDESQDLNRCQQELVLRAGRRLVFVGDPHQAIYGFAGADCKSMDNMKERLEATPAGVVCLPLNETRRCAKAIVTKANTWVKDFFAHESNPEGTVQDLPYSDRGKVLGYRQSLQDGDMVLCRVNAPLIRECFRLIRDGKKANIRGRDIARGLISTVEKLWPKGGDITAFQVKLAEWVEREVTKENKKKNPRHSHIVNIQDRQECLMVFVSQLDDPENAIKDDLKTKIEYLFEDDTREGITLSSIHKAKGLEATRVVFLNGHGMACPHPMAKTGWGMEQEENLCYVAVTRAISELILVNRTKAELEAEQEGGI